MFLVDGWIIIHFNEYCNPAELLQANRRLATFNELVFWSMIEFRLQTSDTGFHFNHKMDGKLFQWTADRGKDFFNYENL